MRAIDYFDTAVEAYATRVALVDGRATCTFAELQRMSHAIAAALSAVPKPARFAAVAIWSPNDFRVIACMLGIMRAGYAVVPVHGRDSAEEVAKFLSSASAACVFYHSSLQQAVADARGRVAATTVWVCLDADDGPDPSLEAFVSTTAHAVVRDWGGVRAESKRPVFIRQTSGTTGPPKLVVDDGVSFNAAQRVLRQVLARGCDDAVPVFLAVAPLSHATGVYAFSLLTLGAAVVIVRDFDVDEIFGAIERHRVTHVWLPPTALYLLLDSAEAGMRDCSTLRHVVLGAAAVSAEKLREAIALFGPCVSVNYSQIESGFLTWLDARTIAAAVNGDHPERLTSSGTSLFMSRVGIMSEDGRLERQGRTGEIVVRGSSVKRYTDAAATAAARRFGWHHTGDLGYIDEHGYLFVVGRVKDVVISGGFKVSATEVERVIMELPEISECAVIGTADDVRGEAVTAVVSVRGGQSLSNDSIVAHCRSKLGDVKSPRIVVQWPQLPKTPVGKIDKRQIRNSFQAAP